MVKDIRTTGIGSIPHSSIEEGIAFSLKHDLPFLPQFYKSEGSMIDIASGISYPHIDYFLESLLENNQNILKLQLVGPISSDLSLDVLKRNIEYLEKKARSFTVTMFIDEPILIHSLNLDNLITFSKERFSLTGLHCCNSNIDPEIINSLNIDIFSYDTFINPHLSNNLHLDILPCYGLINSNNEINTDVNVKTGSLISTTCGLALAQINDVDYFNIFEKLRAQA